MTNNMPKFRQMPTPRLSHNFVVDMFIENPKLHEQFSLSATRIKLDYFNKKLTMYLHETINSEIMHNALFNKFNVDDATVGSLLSSRHFIYLSDVNGKNGEKNVFVTLKVKPISHTLEYDYSSSNAAIHVCEFDIYDIDAVPN